MLFIALDTKQANHNSKSYRLNWLKIESISQVAIEELENNYLLFVEDITDKTKF